MTTKLLADAMAKDFIPGKDCCVHCGETEDLIDWAGQNYCKKHYKPSIQKPTEENLRKDELLKLTHAKNALAATISLKDAMKDGIPPMNWRVDNLLPIEGITIIGAEQKCYKSTFSILITLCIAEGIPVLDHFETTQGTVLYVDEENSLVGLQRRFGQVANGLDLDTYPENIYLCSFQGIRLDTKEGAYVLEHLISELEAEVIVLDSMVRLMEGDEDKAREVRMVFETLKDLKTAYNCEFVILHHTRKTQKSSKNTADLRGSGDFGAFADVVLMLTRKNFGFTLLMDTNRHIDTSEIQPLKVSVRNPDGDKDRIVLEEQGLDQSPKYAIDEVIQALREWLSGDRIETFRTKTAVHKLQARGYGRDQVNKGLSRMVDNGWLRRTKQGVYDVLPGAYLVEVEQIG